LIAVLPAGAVGQTVKIDRDPLTFRDSGLYCNYRMWHDIDPATEDVTNMLSAERAASKDSPWSFYIMQYQAPERRRPDFDARTICAMAQNGKKVILRAGIGRTHKTPDVDEMERRLANLLDEINPDWLYAITLDEEQVYWHGWAAALTELYHRCKKRWPNLPVYQWWSPMQVPNVRAESGWIALPADGWVIDLYGQHRDPFEKKLVKCLETGKPVIHIAWASPDWPKFCGAKSWDDGGRQVFDDQLDVCRSYNVPVAFFCTQKYVERDGKRVQPIRWGWHAPDPIVRRWYLQLEVMALNRRLLADSQIGFRKPDKRLFDWAHGSSNAAELAYSLDDRRRVRFAWSPALAKLPIKAGEHTLEHRYAKLTLTLDDSAAKLDGRLSVRSIKGRPNRVPLVFRIEPRCPVADLTVTADVYAHKSLGGFVEITVSTDGKTWLPTAESDPAARSQQLTIASPTTAVGTAPLWLRVSLQGNAGLPSNRASSLNGLKIAASIEPALDRLGK